MDCHGLYCLNRLDQHQRYLCMVGRSFLHGRINKEQREELIFMSSKLGHLGEAYEEWVHQPIVSKGGPRFFKNNLVEFENFGSLEQHSFARNRLWSLDNDPSPLPPTNSPSLVDLVLKSNEEDLKTGHAEGLHDGV